MLPGILPGIGIGIRVGAGLPLPGIPGIFLAGIFFTTFFVVLPAFAPLPEAALELLELLVRLLEPISPKEMLLVFELFTRVPLACGIRLPRELPPATGSDILVSQYTTY